MTKLGLAHFDAGGPVVTAQGQSTAPGGPQTQAPSYSGAMNNMVGIGELQSSGALGGQNSAPNQAVGYLNQLNPLQQLQNLTQTGFQASGVNITPGTNAAQLGNAYNQAQYGIGQSANLMNQLQGQNGIQNQSNVYNQLQGVANGTGPNPAQAQLAQATGQNVANQAALMAGQRGATANPGLIARQAAQQGASTQQQAAGQAANLQAQQSLNAINAQGQIAQNQVNQLGQGVNAYNQAAQNEQNALQSANTAYNNANVSQQAGINNVNASIAQGNQQASNNLLGGLFSGASGAISAAFGAEGGVVKKMADGGDADDAPSEGTANLGDQGYTSQANSGGAQIGTAAPAPSGPNPFSSGGGKSSGGGSGLSSLISMLADGGFAAPTPVGQIDIGKAPSAPGQSANPFNPNENKQASQSGSYLSSWLKNKGQMPGQTVAGGPMDAGSPDTGMMTAAKGGKVPALLSPGERYLPPQEAKKVAMGKENAMRAGKKVPGKAPVGGAKNDYANDIVPAKLEEGGIVIPRSITQGKDAPKKAAEFVRKHLAKKGLR